VFNSVLLSKVEYYIFLEGFYYPTFTLEENKKFTFDENNTINVVFRSQN
jgi:hypothetical protein